MLPLAGRLALPLMLSGGAGKGEPAILRASIEVAGFQGRVGLVDDLEFFLGFLVAAMRVRVVLLDEDLVPCLEPHRGKWRINIENGQRLLTRRHGARLGVPVVPVMAVVGAAVRTVLATGIEPERVAYPRSRAMPFAEPPTRPLPDRVPPDLGFDLALAHAGVIIPRHIVGPDMLETEPVIAVEFEPRFRRTEIAAGLAPGMVARAHRRHRFRCKNGINRLAPHGAQYGWPLRT